MTLATALFGISVQLLVTTTPPILLDNLTQEIDNTIGETLRIDWAVRKVIGSSADECTVSVYNLNSANRRAVEQAKLTGLHYPQSLVTGLVLSVGWGGVPERLFEGELRAATATQQDGPDVLTHFSAITGGTSWYAPPSGGSEVGLTADILLTIEATRLGLTVGAAVAAKVSERAAQLPISVWKRPSDREPLQLIDWLMAALDLTWGVVGARTLVVYENGLRVDLPTVVLTPKTGLLAWDIQADGMLAFEGLAQPRVCPGVKLQIADGFDAAIAPPLRCESVEFTGSTHGQSVMRGTARKVELIQ